MRINKPDNLTAPGRVVSPLASGVFFGSPLDAKATLPDVPPNVLSIFPHVHDPLFLVNEAMKRDLSQVERLRFDPVNVCNLRCVFCPQELDHKYAQIEPAELEPLLEAIAPTCRRINFGCGFEPMFPKNFAEYGRIIRGAIETKFANFPVVSITTNGMWLAERDLTDFAEILSWLHVSCHSHQRDVFEQLEVDAKFETVQANLLMVRQRYPHVRLHLECVTNQLNAEGVVGFIDWAFNTIDVNSLNLRRMDAGIHTNEGSPLDKSNKAGLTLALNDAQWEELQNRVTASFPAVVTAASTGPHRITDSIELTKTDILPEPDED